MKKIILVSCLIILFVIVLGDISLAQTPPSAPTPAGAPLEIQYPEFGGFKPETRETDIADYAKYIYYLLLGVSGFIAVGVIVFAGVRYLTSAGMPEKMKDARDQITAAISGLIILFLSVLILRIINPSIVIFNAEPLNPAFLSLPPGVYLCKESAPIPTLYSLLQSLETASPEEKRQKQNEVITYAKDIANKCFPAGKIKKISEEFDDKVTAVYLVPGKSGDQTISYSVLLFDKENWGGPISYAYCSTAEQCNNVATFGVSDNVKPSSVTTILMNPSPKADSKVDLFEKTNFNESFPNAAQQTITLSNDWAEAYNTTLGSNKLPASMKITGDYVAVLAKRVGGTNDWTNGVVFASGDYRNLIGYPQITCTNLVECEVYIFGGTCISPCPDVIFLMSGRIQ